MKIARTYFVAALVCLLLPSIGAAFTLKSLLMPGRVIEAHASVEDECGSCHEETEEQSQSSLCFSCHVEVRDDVAANTGYHGLNPAAGDALCSDCHTDHEGRDAEITEFVVESFNHTFTDFPLAGAHGEAVCADCHQPEVAFRDAPGQCVDCHAEEDPHMGTLGSDCASCHVDTTWAEARFDHSTTDFPLTGKHADALCTGCHQDQVFVGTPELCVDCHRSEDTHVGRNGDNCGSCHVDSAWAVTRFDHSSAATGFGLVGSHASLQCESCHVTDLATALPKTCVGCHENDDPHESTLGSNCSSCHNNNQWQQTSFDHAEVSDFSLNGAHATLQCANCHEGDVSEPLASDCVSCHEADPHQGQLGSQCESCHSETAWQSSIRFDHDLASFPLLGRHAALECVDCHATPAFHDVGAICEDCHADDDVHDGSFGEDCATCHNAGAWQAWIFDHDLQTGFPLTGAHGDLSCATCHSEPLAEMTSVAEACGQCHRRDDPHRGRFGADCGSCHTVNSFSELDGF